MFDRLYVDAPSLVYRAFFAVPKTITDAEGRSVNAARGFMDMVAWLVQEHGPGAVVAVFDADWRPAFRVAAYAGYKAERPEDPVELPWQFQLLAEVLDAAGIPRAEAHGFEADDAIATLVGHKRHEEVGAIVTGDRDLLALVRDPDVKLLYPVKGVRDLAVFDEAQVEQRYGVPPRLYADFAMLRGDPSDGLPGVAGVGPVRAARLLREFGSVQGILAHLDRLPARQAAAFGAADEYLRAMQVVVPLRRDVDVVATDGGDPDARAMRALAERHNLGGPTERLLGALGADR